MSISISQSTGPVTEAGKQCSSLNATTHGLFTQPSNFDEKRRKQYADLLATYTADLRPKGAVEIGLVRTIADTQFRLDHCRRIENSLVHEDRNDPHKMVDSLNRLSLYAQRLARTLHATLKEFRKEQAARLEREAAEMKAVAKPAPTTEFVFSTLEMPAPAPPQSSTVDDPTPLPDLENPPGRYENPSKMAN